MNEEIEIVMDMDDREKSKVVVNGTDITHAISFPIQVEWASTNHLPTVTLTMVATKVTTRIPGSAKVDYAFLDRIPDEILRRELDSREEQRNLLEGT